MSLVYEKGGYELIGAAMDVYNEMGPGFLEEVYQECLEMELRQRNIPFQSQIPLELWYKREKLEKRYRPDLFVFNTFIVELKAKKTLAENDEAQLLNYLKGTKIKGGYLFNFGAADKLQYERRIF